VAGSPRQAQASRCMEGMAEIDEDSGTGEDRSAAVMYLLCLHVLATMGAAMQIYRVFSWGQRCMRHCVRRRVPSSAPLALRKGRSLQAIMRYEQRLA
jgi:hypothetical protein